MFGKSKFEAIFRFGFSCFVFEYQMQLQQVDTRTDHIDFSLTGPLLDAPFNTMRSTTLMIDHNTLIYNDETK